MRRRRIGEFELIARYFAPLAKGFPGAGGLLSDNAFLPSDSRRDLVVKTDTVVAGVHFLADEKPELVAAKALRVCLSDLAAGGGGPLTHPLPPFPPNAWKQRRSRGFAPARQPRYGIVLSGGDTVTPPGPLTVTVTAFGRVAHGRGLTRAGARTGDRLFVTGTMGDGALGLLAARGRITSAALEKRYRLPQPRSVLGPRLVGIASAAAHFPDGLLADAGHIADASRLAVRIERERVPLSAAARRVIAGEPDLWANVLGGGDDYELVIAVPPRKEAALLAAARSAKVKITAIGTLMRGEGVELTVAGRPVRAPRKGYVHF